MSELTRQKLITVAVYALVLGLIVALLAAGTALANTQTIRGTASPTKHPQKVATKTAIEVLTTTGATTPGERIAAATRAQVYFDNDFVFTTAGLPVCRANLNGITAQMARAACPTSIVGTGDARVALAGFTDTILNASITAFNAPPRNGHPVLVLHSWTEAVSLGTTLVGEIKPANRRGYGKVLDVTIPALPLGSAIIEFRTKVFRTWKAKGKLQSYAKARCATKRWLYSGTFTYDDGTAKTANSSQRCSN
jgi:hypothetical protein